MKIRKGFVSNSSSASFCCEVCGDCWDSDHSPTIDGGLCEHCEKEQQFCNSCKKLLPIESLFKTLPLTILRGRDLLQEEHVECGEGYVDWPTTYTCASCMPHNPKLVEAWVQNEDFQHWQKRVADPNHEMTSTDELLSTAVLKADK